MAMLTFRATPNTVPLDKLRWDIWDRIDDWLFSVYALPPAGEWVLDYGRMEIEASGACTRGRMYFSFTDEQGNIELGYDLAEHWFQVAFQALHAEITEMATGHGWVLETPPHTPEALRAQADAPRRRPMVELRDRYYNLYPNGHPPHARRDMDGDGDQVVPFSALSAAERVQVDAAIADTPWRCCCAVCQILREG